MCPIRIKKFVLLAFLTNLIASNVISANDNNISSDIQSQVKSTEADFVSNFKNILSWSADHLEMSQKGFSIFFTFSCPLPDSLNDNSVRKRTFELSSQKIDSSNVLKSLALVVLRDGDIKSIDDADAKKLDLDEIINSLDKEVCLKLENKLSDFRKETSRNNKLKGMKILVINKNGKENPDIIKNYRRVKK